MKLISLETAELAKEKGYNIPTIFYFIGNKSEPQEEEAEKGPYNWNERAGFSCPTQSNLQEWLRNVHKLHIMVEPDKSSKEDLVVWFSNVITLKVYDTNYKNFYQLTGIHFETTYEKALEHALQSALKQLT